MLTDGEKDWIRRCMDALNAGIAGFKARRAQLEMIAAVANTLARCRAEDEAAGNGDHIKQFSLTNGVLSSASIAQSPETFNFPGENVTNSSKGTTAGTGIVWAISPGASCPVLDHCNPSGAGALRAYDATNLGTELYSSTQNVTRDGLSSFVKFTVP